ncbi:MAG TPA: DUF4156 domain-containing protein [Gammaproteobacteria bacterium]|nr:DUF4156 domain-containing protein [Gammaproteobacteria bacterium]
MRALNLLAIAVALATSGCTWVSVSSQAQQQGVIALSLDRVANCRLLSQTTVSIANSVGVFQRMPSDVEHDLTNLAINDAAKSGGDTVAALSPVKDGAQTFGIYKCLNSSGRRADASPAPAASTTGTATKTTPYRPPLD